MAQARFSYRLTQDQFEQARAKNPSLELVAIQQPSNGQWIVPASDISELNAETAGRLVRFSGFVSIDRSVFEEAARAQHVSDQVDPTTGEVLREAHELLADATAQMYKEHFGEDERQFIENVQRLQGAVWGEREINERIGRLYRRFLTRGNLTSTLNHAIKLLVDANSRYALREDGTTTAWNFVSAMTQYVTDKAYINSKAEKTLEIMEHVAGDLLVLGEERKN